MDRLSDWRAAAWVAFCLAGLAAAVALILPAALDNHGKRSPRAKPEATLVPQTHLFGQRVTATLAVPARLRIKATFAPYRVVRRTFTRAGGIAHYEFTLDCLRSACVGAPGAERKLVLPPVQIVFPNGRTFVGLWPALRQASRLAPNDLTRPRLRGEMAAPPHEPTGPNRLAGVLLAVAAALALVGAGLLGFSWFGWRPLPAWSSNGKRTPSALEYALIVAGIAAGGGQEDRRAALESLAIALDERGLGHLAGEARRLAWSPQPPAGEAVRRLASDVQTAKEAA
jgi:hypothetical protein